jgi:hypothetical protein
VGWPYNDTLVVFLNAMPGGLAASPKLVYIDSSAMQAVNFM